MDNIINVTWWLCYHHMKSQTLVLSDPCLANNSWLVVNARDDNIKGRGVGAGDQYIWKSNSLKYYNVLIVISYYKILKNLTLKYINTVMFNSYLNI